jgi:hypothetical protein
MATHPEWDDYLKDLVNSAARARIGLQPALDMTSADAEEACAKWIAYGTVRFMTGEGGAVTSMMAGSMQARDVATWKIFSDYGEFDVQIGYLAGKLRTKKSFTGRLTVTVRPAGGDRYMFRVRDWASGYNTEYLIQVVGSSAGGFRAQDVVSKSDDGDVYYGRRGAQV